MELKKLEYGGVTVDLELADLSALEQCCLRAEDELMSLEDSELLTTARAFRAFFQAARAAASALEHMPRDKKDSLLAELDLS